MRIHLGTDHAGLELKDHLVEWLKEQGHDPMDHGSYVFDDDDDYPPFCLRAAEAVASDPGSVGIVVGGSGKGEQIGANKVHGIRAALAWSRETAELARQHNNANVISVGSRMHSLEEATELVAAFLAADFTGEERHVRRIVMLADYEDSGLVPESSVADAVMWIAPPD
ncbi:MAG: ribose-5-phosphate isomerase [Nocardioidaceae bacterium]